MVRSLVEHCGVGMRFGDSYNWKYNGTLTATHSAAIACSRHGLWNHVWTKPVSAFRREVADFNLSDAEAARRLAELEIVARKGSSIPAAMLSRCVVASGTGRTNTFPDVAWSQCSDEARFNIKVTTEGAFLDGLVRYLTSSLGGGASSSFSHIEPPFVRDDCPLHFDSAMDTAVKNGAWKGVGWMKYTYLCHNTSAPDSVYARVKPRFLDRFERQYGSRRHKVKN